MDLASNDITWTGDGDQVSAAAQNASFPLHDAAHEGRAHLVRLLLEHGHSAYALDGEGLMASDRAREAGYYDLAIELEKRKIDKVPRTSGALEIARLSIKELFGLVQGKPETVAALISAGRVHAIDGKGDTPLHICAAQGRLQFCDQLIKAGADPAASNFERRKPHDRAAENGQAMVAGLLRSLLPQTVPANVVSAVPKWESKINAPTAERWETGSLEDALELNDLDLDFYGEDEAEDYHQDIKRDDYVASFDTVEGRVTRLGNEDGADLEFDDLDIVGCRIDAEDIIAPPPQTAEFADAATFRSFLDVRMGRRSAINATAPTTRYYAISDDILLLWVESVIMGGGCVDEDVDRLIGSIRGSFDTEVVRTNLVYELTSLGMMQVHDESRADSFVAGELPDPEDLVDLLSCICNGSNMRPGVELKTFSARSERRLFNELAAKQHEICRTLVCNAMLVSVVVMLGDRVEAGTVESALLTGLDVQYGRQTQDAEVLSAALSYLVAYQNLLKDGDITSEDREQAFEAVLAMKLSRIAVDLIAKGVEANSDLDSARKSIEKAAAERDHYRQILLLEHLPVVRRLASRREVHLSDVEDLVQDGVFGLMRAIELFDPDRGYRLMTYSQFRIRQTIARALNDVGSLVRVPTHRAVEMHKIDRFEERIMERMPAEALIALLSEELEIPVDTVREIRRIPRRPVPFIEILPDSLDFDSPQFRERLSRQRTEVIDDFLADMPERAANVVVRRFGLRGEDEMTLEELGAVYGVTRERIRQIEAKRLAEMRHPAYQRLLRNLL